MLRVGLTGGIGAGKSTVVRRWDTHGAVVVDADLIAREVVAAGSAGLQQLVNEFGAEVRAADGTLDRPMLASRVFGDDESRAKMNGILHPLIGARTAELVSAAPADAIVVQDVPLLVEGGMAPMFHLVVVVHASEDERMQRLVSQRGMTVADAQARIDTQASDAERRAAADVWLDNNGAPTALQSTVDSLWTRRLEPFEHNLRRRNAVVRDQVVLVPADPDWAAQARRLVARLRVACGERALRADHIGSTAVPGLPAQDVLDFQVTVDSLADADALAEPLAEAGFPRRAHIGDGVLHHGADPARPVNVHLRVAGTYGQRFALIFRDWLQANPGLASEYVRTKQDAAEAANTLDEYTAALQPWFEDAYPRALSWAERTAWSEGAEHSEGAGSS